MSGVEHSTTGRKVFVHQEPRPTTGIAEGGRMQADGYMMFADFDGTALTLTGTK